MAFKCVNGKTKKGHRARCIIRNSVFTCKTKHTSAHSQRAKGYRYGKTYKEKFKPKSEVST